MPPPFPAPPEWGGGARRKSPAEPSPAGRGHQFEAPFHRGMKGVACLHRDSSPARRSGASYKAVISTKTASAEEPEAALLGARDAFGADIVVALRGIGRGESLGEEKAAEIDAVAVETDRGAVLPRPAGKATGDLRLAGQPGGEQILRLLLARQGAPRLGAVTESGGPLGGSRRGTAIAARRRAGAEEREGPSADAQGGGAGGLGGGGGLRAGGPRPPWGRRPPPRRGGAP